MYVNKPGPVELTVAHHTYDVIWMDPADGTTQKRKYSGEHFVGEPPRPLSRLGAAPGERRHAREHEPLLQVRSRATCPFRRSRSIPEKVPFEIDAPSGDLAVGKAAYFSAKLKRASRGTRDMLWLWTCEVTEGHGYRVIGTSQQGTFYPLAGLAIEYPAVLLLRVYGINNYGTVYMSPKGFGLNQ